MNTYWYLVVEVQLHLKFRFFLDSYPGISIDFGWLRRRVNLYFYAAGIDTAMA
jgi:hypothetical protein